MHVLAVPGTAYYVVSWAGSGLPSSVQRYAQRLVKVPDFAGEQQQGIDRRFNDLLLSQGIGACLHNTVLHHHVYSRVPQAVRDHISQFRQKGILPPAGVPEPLAPHLLPGSYDLGR